MSGIEILGLLYTASPAILYGIEYLQRAWPSFVSRCAEHGTLLAIWLPIALPEALQVMSKVERFILQAEEQEVIAFMETYTNSFSMIGVAGAITAQIAITALTLTRLTDSHWTAEALFVISLVTGALSVFFSCLNNPAFHGLHKADDIKDFLAKPSVSAQTGELVELLSAAEQAPTLSEQELGDIEQYVTQCRWQVASPYAAIMLVAPLRLLKSALNSFLVGLGIYLGRLYTENLIPAFGHGSLGILIVFILTAFTGIALYYLPQGFKAVENEPLARFRRLVREHDPSKSYGTRRRLTRAWGSKLELRRHEVEEPLRAINKIVHKSPFLERHMPSEFRQFLDRYSPKPVAEVLTRIREIPTEDLTPPTTAEGTDVVQGAASSFFGTTGSLQANSSASNDIQSVLESLVCSQEETLRASRQLLEVIQNSSKAEEFVATG